MWFNSNSMRSGKADMRAWLAAACVACATLAGCGLFSDDSKRVPTPLVDFKATMAPRVSWSTSVGSSGIYNLAPAIVGTAVYAASVDGNVVRIDATNGSSKWRSSVDLKISAGVDRKSTRLNSSHIPLSRMPSSA